MKVTILYLLSRYLNPRLGLNLNRCNPGLKMECSAATLKGLNVKTEEKMTFNPCRGCAPNASSTHPGFAIQVY